MSSYNSFTRIPPVPGSGSTHLLVDVLKVSEGPAGVRMIYALLSPSFTNVRASEACSHTYPCVPYLQTRS